MRETATLLQGVAYQTDGYRPFDELEVPGTSVLVASAAMAGYLPIAEYEIQKINKDNRRTTRKGRADLWFIAGECSYSFEMKRAWNRSTQATLKRSLVDAEVCASEIPRKESDKAFGVVIAPIFSKDDIATYRAFDADYSFCVGEPKDPQVFFFFKEHHR